MTATNQRQIAFRQGVIYWILNLEALIEKGSSTTS
jgi:hypothetical protein